MMWSCSKMWLRGAPLLSNTRVIAICSLAVSLQSLHSVSYSLQKAMRLGLMIKTTALLVDHTLAHFFVASGTTT